VPRFTAQLTAKLKHCATSKVGCSSEAFTEEVHGLQEAPDLPQEIARLLYTPRAPDQLFTWLVPTDGVIDAVKSSRDALASSVENASLVRSATLVHHANGLFHS
jgi:hypothetical protein